MPNIIELNLLQNKSIVATMQGYPLANENSYKIIAGEENATKFIIKSIPNQYANARLTVEMVNSQGLGIAERELSEIEVDLVSYKGFILPVGMAVAGYGYVSIKAYIGDEVAVFQPLKLKVWNTIPQWQDYVDKTTNVRIENGYLILTENGTEYNLGYVQGEDGKTPYIGGNGNWFVGEEDTGVPAKCEVSNKYVNEQIDKAVLPLKKDIADLYLLSNATVTGTEEIAEKYTARQTANELSGLIDGALTRVEKVQGNTVAVDNELKNAYFKGIKSTGRNLFDSKLLLSVPTWQQDGDVFYGNSSYLHAVYGEPKGGIYGRELNWTQQVTISLDGKTTALSSAVVGFVYTSGVTQYLSIESTEYQHYVLTSYKGETIKYIILSYANDAITYVKNMQIKFADGDTDFEPYTEEIYQLPQTLELGEWDSFNPQTGELAKGTEIVELDGTEDWGVSQNDSGIYFHRYDDKFINGGVFINNKFPARQFWEDVPCAYLLSGSCIVFPNADKDNPTITTIEQWKAKLAEWKAAGNPLTGAYKSATPTTETIANAPKSYKAYNHGSETVVQGETDNSKFGAENTVTNTYAVKKGV